uniref:Uncharacterized protein n=1 Tax=Panagrolaimus sp. ES5 TaxID=591445 RepID=A0AC34G8Q4_9BILA
MATKYYCLSDNTFDESLNDQYSNLNLNHNYQSLDADYVHSKSAIKNSRKIQNPAATKLSDFTDLNDVQAKQSWKRSNENLQTNFLNTGHESEEEDEFKKSKSANKSTLSLHISEYENLIEAKAAYSGGLENDDKKTNLIKKWCIFKQDFIDPALFIKNPFEFPRQQEDQGNHPEMMQFKASQRLLNPNEENKGNNRANMAVSI